MIAGWVKHIACNNVGDFKESLYEDLNLEEKSCMQHVMAMVV